MKIVSAQSCLLSDLEVMLHLRRVKKAKKKHQGEQLATITYQTLRYLEQSPAAQQCLDGFRIMNKKLQDGGYNLSRYERLNVVNLLPATGLELQLMIENYQERFSEEQEKEILKIIKEHVAYNKSKSQEPKPGPSSSSN